MAILGIHVSFRGLAFLWFLIPPGFLHQSNQSKVVGKQGKVETSPKTAKRRWIFASQWPSDGLFLDLEGFFATKI